MPISARLFARFVRDWVTSICLEASAYGLQLPNVEHADDGGFQPVSGPEVVPLLEFCEHLARGSILRRHPETY